MLKKKYLAAFFALVGLLVFASVQVLADVTTIREDLTPSGETKLSDILSGYGTLIRIDDFNASLTDQIWKETDGSVHLEVKYAGDQHTLGYYLGTSGGTFQTISKVSGSGSTATWLDTGTKDETFLAGGTDSIFRFGLRNHTEGYDWSSKIYPDNSDCGDHMVTWKVVDTGNYIIAWDDRDPGPSGTGVPDPGSPHWYDLDFNDLVIEVSNAQPVPEPGTLLLLGTGLIGLAGYGIRRRKK
jgi:hypothetical protein